jgi:hypothetical protein
MRTLLDKITIATVVGSAFSISVLEANPAQALSFTFQFDNTFNNTLTPPIVGTGTFSFDENPVDGTYALTSLSNSLFSFNFGGDTFGNSDIVTPLSEILVQISNAGQRVTFSNSDPSGFGTGPFGGSIDFINGTSSILSFEPPGFNPGETPTLYIYEGPQDFFAGTYVGGTTAIPTPALLPGLIGMGLAVFRKRKAEAVEEANEAS